MRTYADAFCKMVKMSVANIGFPYMIYHFNLVARSKYNEHQNGRYLIVLIEIGGSMLCFS